MKAMNRVVWVWLLMPLSFLLNPALAQQDAAVDVNTMLVWIERSSTMDAGSAELLRQSLDRRAEPRARLELALLEFYAALGDSATARGLERVRLLADASEDQQADWIEPVAARFLQFLAVHLDEQRTLSLNARDSGARLTRERAAHMATIEKLDALRSIERELEQREPLELESIDDASPAQVDGDG
ncbi:MAG: hypothetical protein AAGH65_07755 [Pseudomonadota bacterium]